ncbi:hypothetical protein EC991_007307 [Linnemannia zychae]|nr:hypothetical protein EC991_007307 [Linnemannia zychae]
MRIHKQTHPPHSLTSGIELTSKRTTSFELQPTTNLINPTLLIPDVYSQLQIVNKFADEFISQYKILLREEEGQLIDSLEEDYSHLRQRYDPVAEQFLNSTMPKVFEIVAGISAVISYYNEPFESFWISLQDDPISNITHNINDVIKLTKDCMSEYLPLGVKLESVKEDIGDLSQQYKQESAKLANANVIATSFAFGNICLCAGSASVAGVSGAAIAGIIIAPVAPYVPAAAGTVAMVFATGSGISCAVANSKRNRRESYNKALLRLQRLGEDADLLKKNMATIHSTFSETNRHLRKIVDINDSIEEKSDQGSTNEDYWKKSHQNLLKRDYKAAQALAKPIVKVCEELSQKWLDFDMIALKLRMGIDAYSKKNAKK